MKIRNVLFLFVALVLAPSIRANAQDATTKANVVTPGSRIAIVGDSITEQKLYSKFMEAYLVACSGVPDLRVFQFGWGGEQAIGFANRLENDLTTFNPSVVTLCYGMNDGSYQPYRDEIGQNYERNMRLVLDRLQKLGIKKIVVGSPGAVDSYFFRPGQNWGERAAHVAYNDNLAHLRDIDRKIASERGLLFADVHSTMYDTMLKAQKALGEKYDVCGGDGFHPGNNGQLLMAYAFLKSLDLDGSIGTIQVDLQGKATATPGHKLVQASANKVNVTSTRWPFCFQGDEKSSHSTRSIVGFTSFNNDLNRFQLQVKGISGDSATVKWGNAEKRFTKEQLEKGVNLAAEFSQTPFDEPFQKLLEKIAVKQEFETYMIKGVVTNFRSIPKELADDEEMKKAIATFRQRFAARHEQLATQVQAAITAVDHTIEIIQ